ncbi:MAG: glycosyltransferase, partial [Actinobacteria bacterium]|nr:glycosyltransferase [Actinomycetota bacterium]
SLFDEFDIEWARRILENAEIEPFEGNKILFIIDHFPPEVGGAERFATELGLEFAKLGLLVDIATLSRSRDFHYYNGLNVFEFEYDIGPYEPSRSPRFEELREFALKGDYDLILVNGGIRNWAMWSLDEPEKYPAVFVPIINRESIDFLDTEHEIREKLVERLKSARTVISLTRTGHDVEFYCENDIPFSVIPNAANFVSPTVDFRRKVGIPDDTKLLLCAGSYYKAKNQLWLVENLKHMPGNWVLVAMGRVMLEPYYHEILSKVRGDCRFLVLPPQEKGMVASAMEQADLLLLPSQSEAFGRVVLEAMSHRLPWIASSYCAGLKDVKGGRLVQLEREPDDGFISSAQKGKAIRAGGLPRSPFIQEVRRLLSDSVERTRLGEEGYRDWKENYQWKNFVGRYLDAAGIKPDLRRSVHFRKNTIDPKPARPENIELLRVENEESEEPPLVTVVLPTYSRPESLETAIGSVLDQTYEIFEVIVVNDGGPDVSRTIEKFDDPRLIYINNRENTGPAGARNVGIKASRGSLVAYLDDDDRYYPTHLETLVQAIESSKTRAAYTDSYSVFMAGEGDHWRRKKKELVYSKNFDREMLFADNYIPIICLMHDADLLEDAGVFDEDLPCLEDWDLLIRMAMQCDFKHVKEITCEAISHRTFEEHIVYNSRDEILAATKAINDKYDGQVYKARDVTYRGIQSLLTRFETMKNYSLTDAFKYLEVHLEAYTGSPRLEYLCARYYRGQNDLARTKYHLEKCLKLDPGNEEALKDLAEVNMDLMKSSGKTAMTPVESDRVITEAPGGGPLEEPGETPIIVPVLQREDDASAMFKQLEAVTDNYSLVIVNNGLGDPAYLERLNPKYYLENPVGTGAARSVNQGLERLGDEFIAVLRNDVLIYDEGWLENIVSFLRRRADVGLVGIAGWHCINEEGVPDLMTPVFKLRGHPDSNKPTWRFTEVAGIDDAGWVMRNAGFRLSEDTLDEKRLSLELSFKYIKAGFRVYVAAVEFARAEDREDIAKRLAFAPTDGDEGVPRTREEARLAMRMKWENLLPLTRGFTDEAYVMNRVEELARQVSRLEVENAAKAHTLEHVIEHEAQLESALATRRTARLKRFIKERLSRKPLEGNN